MNAPRIVLAAFFLAASNLLAQSDEPTVEVTATGEVAYPVGRAVLQFAVESWAESASDAIATNADVIERLHALRQGPGGVISRVGSVESYLSPIRPGSGQDRGPSFTNGMGASVRFDSLTVADSVLEAVVPFSPHYVQLTKSSGQKPHLDVRFQVHARTAAEVVRMTERLMEDVRQSLEAIGGVEVSFHHNFFYKAESDAPESGRTGEARFRAWDAVEVTVDSLLAVHDVIEAALQAGARELRLARLEVRDQSEAEREALQLATRLARERAEIAAVAAGAELGELLKIVASPPELHERVHTSVEGATTDRTPIVVSATVTLVYRLRDQ